jgi:hypothetical protein
LIARTLDSGVSANAGAAKTIIEDDKSTTAEKFTRIQTNPCVERRRQMPAGMEASVTASL